MYTAVTHQGEVKWRVHIHTCKHTYIHMNVLVKVLFLAQYFPRILIFKGLGENLLFSLRDQMALQQQPVDRKNSFFFSDFLYFIELKIWSLNLKSERLEVLTKNIFVNSSFWLKQIYKQFTHFSSSIKMPLFCRISDGGFLHFFSMVHTGSYLLFEYSAVFKYKLSHGFIPQIFTGLWTGDRHLF